MSAADSFSQIAAGEYISVLTSDPARVLIRDLVRGLYSSKNGVEKAGVNDDSSNSSSSSSEEVTAAHVAAVGLAALNAFLQLNVTGPVLESVNTVERIFSDELGTAGGDDATRPESNSPSPRKPAQDARSLCLRSLDVDGVSVYPYIPSIELFALARYALASRLANLSTLAISQLDAATATDIALASVPWLQLRVHVWHHRLFIHPNVGSNSGFNRGAQWSDVPSLQEAILKSMAEAEEALPPGCTSTQRGQFYVEKANVCIMLGLEAKAKAALADASMTTGFVYALSGALGKRTRFQENSTSQLVVLAKSAVEADAKTQVAPEALPLNDDTLLEKVDFADAKNDLAPTDSKSHLPTELRDIAPDAQPQLSPLDQIILLAEATLKDALSPVDSLTSEEILPFAERVVSDQKSTNWQIYTQALLVRSRIEVHRSRTVERGVLQMQAVVDQILVDTTAVPAATEAASGDNSSSAVPVITITEAGAEETPTETSTTTKENNKENDIIINKPTSFFPAAEPSDTAPVQTRLQYIHALSSPPRWHLESELAFAWTGVGSLVAALDIFKRLRLWAEVALCLASAGAHADQDDTGRGLGGEEKARAVLRWRLFNPTDSTDADADAAANTDAAAASPDVDDPNVDVSALRSSSFQGSPRDPAPPDAPRLFCILGDVEDEPAHYEAAWAISGGRYARAQRSLGEHRLRRQDWARAREAYLLATAANRLSSEMWSRLGDINLRLGRFADAAEAFRRAIAATSTVAGDTTSGAAEDARTWSNLASALYSLYCEAVDEAKKKKEKARGEEEKGGDDDDEYTNKKVEKEQEVSTTGDLSSSATNGNGNDSIEVPVITDDDGDDDITSVTTTKAPDTNNSNNTHDPATLLSQSMAAYKRGATLAHSNWRIWDNVITLASRVSPPAVNEILPALSEILRIRGTEDAVDVGILRLLLDEVLLSTPAPAPAPASASVSPAASPAASAAAPAAPSAPTGVYEPPRGTLPRRVVDLVEKTVVPMITTRSELWSLVGRERAWRRDWAGAVDAAEKGWRAAIGAGGAGVSGGGGGGAALLAPGAAPAAAGPRKGDGDDSEGKAKARADWRVDEAAFDELVRRTDELVSVLENYGPDVEGVGSRWRGKARTAVKSVMGKARESWEGSEGWKALEGLLDGLA